MRYTYLGDKFSDPELTDQPCEPVLRGDGRCIVAGSKQLVTFADGTRRLVMRRRLRLNQPPATTPQQGDGEG